MQSLLCVIIISTFTCTMFMTLPYRLFSSNVILLACFSGLTINFIFGFLNASGLESALTVGSTESSVLSAVNFLVAFIVLMILMIDIFSPYCKWPPDLALHKINKGPISFEVKKWISTIRRANVVLVDCFQASNEMVDIGKLESTAWDLRQCWLQAKSHSSVFELVLREVLEKLLLIHAQKSPTALRNLSPQWDKEFESTVSKLKEKTAVYNLMNKKKRILLYKLMAIRFILGNRKIFKSDMRNTCEIDNLRNESNRFLAICKENNNEIQMKVQICRGLIAKWNHLIFNYDNRIKENGVLHAFSEKDLCEWLEYRNKLGSITEKYEGNSVACQTQLNETMEDAANIYE